MKKIVAILSGDPNSINSEIIAKTWKKRKKLGNINFFIIGNFLLLNKQFLKMNYKIKIKKMTKFENKNFKKNLYIFDIPIKFNEPFSVGKNDRKKYIIKSFELALNLVKKKNIIGLINCAINKKDLFSEKKYSGITEYLSEKIGYLGKEAMLIYNQSLSVSPLTTHIKLKNVVKFVNKKRIISKTITLDDFFKKRLKIRPKIGILGLNPHNDENRVKSEENKIILPAIKALKKRGLKIFGPISPDTAFIDFKKNKFNILIGMYHDQVLTPFKSIFKFDAINITTGLPFLRISPDHGIGKEIILKNKANPKSLINSINFFKKINA